MIQVVMLLGFNEIMKWQNMSSLSETLNTDSLNASSLYDTDAEYVHILSDTEIEKALKEQVLH